MIKSLMVVIALLAIIALGAGTVCGQGQVPGDTASPPPGTGVPGVPGGTGHPGGPGMPGGMAPAGLHAFGFGPVLQGLNLTSAQTDQISAICKAHVEKSTPIRQKMADKRDQLLKATFAEHPDTAQILALQKELVALQDSLAASEVDGLSALSRALTADQKTKFLDNLQRFHRRAPGMGGPAMSPGAARAGIPGMDPGSMGLTEMLRYVMREPYEP